MTRRANGRVNAVVVPALVVHRVRQDDLDLAGIDLVLDRVDQAEVLVLEVATCRGREKDHRPPELAEPQKLHFAIERGGPPFDVFAIHELSTLPRGRAILYDPPLLGGPMRKKKIGLLFGMEDTFPWALINAVNERGGGDVEAGPCEISYLK